MKFLFALHDPPYGSERTYNGLRWARELLNADGNEVRVFLFGDAVVAAMTGQKTPPGYYNAANMLRGLAEHGAAVGCCGTCLDARGIADELAVKGTHRSSMAELAEWTNSADTVINI